MVRKVASAYATSVLDLFDSMVSITAALYIRPSVTEFTREEKPFKGLADEHE